MVGDFLFNIVPQHGEDLLYKSIKLLLEKEGRVLCLDLRSRERCFHNLEQTQETEENLVFND